MSKNVIIGLVIAAIIGGGALFATQSSNNNSTTSNTENSSQTDSKKDTDAKTTFAPKETTNESFIAAFEGTSEGQPITGEIKADGKGTLYFSGQQSGENATFYITADGSYILCQDTTCFKTTGASTGFNADEFQVTAEDLALYQSNATFVSDEQCGSEKCAVWNYTELDGSGDTKISIRKSDNRVVKVEGKDGADTFKMTYDYKLVTIDVPQNVQELPSFGQ